MNTHLNCILYSRAYRCCNQLQLLIPFQESYDALCIKCILTHTACYLILYGNSDMIAWRVILYEYVEFKQLKRHLQPCARWSMRTIFMDLILGLTCLSLALSFVLPIIYTASTSTTSQVISCNISYTASTSTTSPVTSFNISYTASTFLSPLVPNSRYFSPKHIALHFLLHICFCSWIPSIVMSVTSFFLSHFFHLKAVSVSSSISSV